MTLQRVIIENNETFANRYPSLDHTTVVNCRLRLKPGEEHILVDLLERDVTLIPSATSQLASRSKVHQARIFSEFMVPETTAIYDCNVLLESTTRFNRLGTSRVVVKRDRKNAGIGVHLFESVENVYNQAELGTLGYPFVLQPFIEDFIDIRVIILGEYIEAYQRCNQSNFRHNLHCGGTSQPFQPTSALLEFCHAVMARGHFPYGHVDLMLLPDETIYLSEINLRGGLKGALIKADEYRQLVDTIHAKILQGIE